MSKFLTSQTPPPPQHPPAVDWRVTPEGRGAIDRSLKQADSLHFRTMSRHDLASLLMIQANLLKSGVDEPGTLQRIAGFALAGLYARLRAEAKLRRSATSHAALTINKMEGVR